MGLIFCERDNELGKKGRKRRNIQRIAAQRLLPDGSGHQVWKKVGLFYETTT